MELKIVKFFNRLGSGWVNKATDVICRIYPFIIFWIVVVSLFLVFDAVNGEKIFLGFFVALFLQFIITEGFLKGKWIKLWKGRVRPYQRYSEIKPIGEKRIDSSFPSSHLSITVLFFVVLLFFYSFLWPLAIVAVLIVGYARIHNGMHYPTDALAGMILGLIYGWVGLWVVSKLFL